MSAGYDFSLVLGTEADPDTFLDEIAERLHASGCDDATFSVEDGLAHASFHRTAANLADAIRSAIRDIESVPGVTVEGLKREEIVTASEIARRVGRTRQSLHQIITGARGPGGFPAPIPGVRAGRTRLYEWPEVARWFSDALGEPSRSDPDLQLAAAFNAALAARRRARELEGPQRDAVTSLLR